MQVHVYVVMHVLPDYEHMCSYIAYLLVSSVFFCRFVLSSLMSLSNLRTKITIQYTDQNTNFYNTPSYSILARIQTFTKLR